jgi:hypothetical protein
MNGINSRRNIYLYSEEFKVRLSEYCKNLSSLEIPNESFLVGLEHLCVLAGRNN